MDQICLSGDAFDPSRAFMINGVAVDIGVKVVRWDSLGGFNGYTTKRVDIEEEDRRTGKVVKRTIKGARFSKRKKGLPGVSQFFIHHSGGDGRNPSGMYETLYNQRGLSVQYAVEDDGRIYQFNDAADCCWHAGAHNQISIGVECCLFPDAAAHPDYYSDANNKKRGNLAHGTMVDVIHGRRRKVFCFTGPQVEALAQLAAANWLAVEILCRRTPAGPPRFPRTSQGIPRTVYHQHMEHRGLIGHLQCTESKWDPAGFPWEDFEAQVASWYSTYLRRR